jgi:hypothetical protein
MLVQREAGLSGKKWNWNVFLRIRNTCFQNPQAMIACNVQSYGGLLEAFSRLVGHESAKSHVAGLAFSRIGRFGL